jgi:Uma2 family endonuclease
METMLEIDEELSDYERERGKPMPSLAHSRTQRDLTKTLLDYPEYEVLPEINLDLEGFRPVADLALYPASHLREVKNMVRLTEPPLLTIEILSPKQALSDLFAKADEYLRHGVEETWIIIPEIQTITVCKAPGEQKTFAAGDVQHGSTGIVVNIEKLFA